MHQQMLIAAGSSAPPVLWTPANTTTQLWFDFGDPGTITTASGAVSAINDKSGNGRHLAQSTVGLRPAYDAAGLNSLGIATFDGTGDRLDRAAGMPGLVQDVGTAMLFILRRFNPSPTVVRYLLIGAGTSTRIAMMGGLVANKPTIGNRRLDADSGQGVTGSADVGTGWGLHCAKWNWAAAELDQYINCAVDGSLSPFQTPGSTSNTALTLLRLGAGGAPTSDGFAGSIAEVVLVHSVDTTLRQRIEGYMLWRRGLQSLLPSGHPYESAPPYV